MRLRNASVLKTGQVLNRQAQRRQRGPECMPWGKAAPKPVRQQISAVQPKAQRIGIRRQQRRALSPCGNSTLRAGLDTRWITYSGSVIRPVSGVRGRRADRRACPSTLPQSLCWWICSFVLQELFRELPRQARSSSPGPASSFSRSRVQKPTILHDSYRCQLVNNTLKFTNAI